MINFTGPELWAAIEASSSTVITINGLFCGQCGQDSLYSWELEERANYVALVYRCSCGNEQPPVKRSRILTGSGQKQERIDDGESRTIRLPDLSVLWAVPASVEGRKGVLCRMYLGGVSRPS